MHQHIVAATVYKDRQGNGGNPLLNHTAEKELKLVSTGAGDWLASTGVMTVVRGGYRYNAVKRFTSGSPAADLLITSGP